MGWVGVTYGTVVLLQYTSVMITYFRRDLYIWRIIIIGPTRQVIAHMHRSHKMNSFQNVPSWNSKENKIFIHNAHIHTHVRTNTHTCTRTNHTKRQPEKQSFLYWFLGKDVSSWMLHTGAANNDVFSVQWVGQRDRKHVTFDMPRLDRRHLTQNAAVILDKTSRIDRPPRSKRSSFVWH